MLTGEMMKLPVVWFALRNDDKELNKTGRHNPLKPVGKKGRDIPPIRRAVLRRPLEK